MDKNNQRYFAGIDIGGTKIYVVVTDENGRILGNAKRKSKPERGFEEVMERAVKTAREACEEADVPVKKLAAVGVGAPSPILEDGTAILAPNMGWHNVPLVKTLAKALDQRVFAENDCNAGTLGEFALGAGKGAKSLAGIFVGTGLGGGIIIDGRMIVGASRMAAEVGHVIVQKGGRTCGCGRLGCLEAYASKTGMAKRFREEIHDRGRASLMKELTGGDYEILRSRYLKEAYQKKDEVTVETLNEMADYLGLGIGNLITFIGPDTVVIGGGVFEALGKELLPRVLESTRAFAYPPDSYNDTRIKLAELGDEAVALGAMVYARQCLEAK